MSLLTITVIVVLILAGIGLGWKTMLTGAISGFNIVVDKVPELKQLTNEAKDYLKSEAIDDVFAHKGLRVFLTTNTNLAGQEVEIITNQFGERVQTHNGYMNNGQTEFELKYDKGTIVNGEFKVCVHATLADIEECKYGYDSREKKQEYISINIYETNLPQPQPEEQQAQAQSQSSNNNNENSLSQSQATTIYICKEGGCTPQ